MIVRMGGSVAVAVGTGRLQEASRSETTARKANKVNLVFMEHLLT
jgi:hypothetical protein